MDCFNSIACLFLKNVLIAGIRQVFMLHYVEFSDVHFWSYFIPLYSIVIVR